MIQEIAININEKNSFSCSKVKYEIGQIFEKKFPMSLAVCNTTKPNLKPTPVNVTTPTIIPTQVAAAVSYTHLTLPTKA